MSGKKVRSMWLSRGNEQKDHCSRCTNR